MGLSTDQSTLYAGSKIGTNVVLAKVNSSNGDVLSAVYTSQPDPYWYVLV